VKGNNDTIGAITNEPTELTRSINRHKARLLCNLEEIDCPAIYVEAVKSAYNWLRSDLQKITNESDTNENKQETNWNR
jgi:hypothetical protein